MLPANLKQKDMNTVYLSICLSYRYCNTQQHYRIIVFLISCSLNIYLLASTFMFDVLCFETKWLLFVWTKCTLKQNSVSWTLFSPDIYLEASLSCGTTVAAALRPPFFFFFFKIYIYSFALCSMLLCICNWNESHFEIHSRDTVAKQKQKKSFGTPLL